MQKFLKIVKECFFGYFENEISGSSAQLSYYFIFSIFPLAITISAFALSTNVGKEIFEIAGEILIPDMLSNLFKDYYEHIKYSDNMMFFSFGLLLSIYSITRYINCIKKKIRKIYEDDREGNVFYEWILSFLFSLILVVGLYFTFVLQSVGEKFFGFIGKNILSLSEDFIKGWMIIRFFIIGLYVFLLCMLLYSLIPKRRLNFKNSSIGAIFASIFWIVTSLLFSVYVDNISNYSVLYGSIGVFIVLMLWLFLINNIILIGALINKKNYDFSEKF